MSTLRNILSLNQPYLYQPHSLPAKYILGSETIKQRASTHLKRVHLGLHQNVRKVSYYSPLKRGPLRKPSFDPTNFFRRKVMCRLQTCKVRLFNKFCPSLQVGFAWGSAQDSMESLKETNDMLHCKDSEVKGFSGDDGNIRYLCQKDSVQGNPTNGHRQ